MPNGAAWSPTFTLPKPTGARVHAVLHERGRVRLKRKPPAQRWHRRQPVAQDDRGGRGARGYYGAKKVKGRKRHLLICAQGLVLGARVQSGEVQDREGVKLLLEITGSDRLHQRLSHLRMERFAHDSQGRGADWARRVPGWAAETVRHLQKMALEGNTPKAAPVERHNVHGCAHNSSSTRALDFGGLPFHLCRL
jgi:hypothetical protein